MAGEPTMAEVLLRLEHITQQLAQVVATVDRLSTTMERSYVRKDVYEANHLGLRREVDAKVAELAADVGDLKAAERDRAKDKRQLWAGITLAGIGALLGIVQGVVQSVGLGP